MLGKDIAENLRQNRDKWTRHKYHNNGSYCVIGLKLHELGVNVKKFEEIRPKAFFYPLNELGVKHFFENKEVTIPNFHLLVDLQNTNDDQDNVENVIGYCEANAEVNFPLEELAAVLKEEGF